MESFRGSLLHTNEIRVLLLRKKGRGDMEWPLKVTATVLNLCWSYSNFGKSTPFKRKKQVSKSNTLGFTPQICHLFAV